MGQSLILAIKTDSTEAEIYILDGPDILSNINWIAHRQLAESLNAKIAQQLRNVNKDYKQLEGIIVFEGPGSFTGLRIGVSVANALAYSLEIPIVAASGRDWLNEGQTKLHKGINHKIALPNYGAEPNILKSSKK